MRVKAYYGELLAAHLYHAVRKRIITWARRFDHRIRLSPHDVPKKRLCCILPVIPWLLAGCSVSAQQEVQRVTENAVAASRVAEDCRSVIGADPRYQRLASHIPLGSPFDATLSQMTDTSLADRDDVASLGLWLSDLGKCRHQIIDITLRDIPMALAVLVVAWNKDDEAFVLLATRKLAWGKAIMAIRTNRAEMLSALAGQILQLSQQASAERQAELSRRVALFSAITNLAP